MFFIPVEITAQEDEAILMEAQQHLESFGFEKDRAALSRYLQDTSVFKTDLNRGMYPVARPAEFAGIYQTWG